MRTLVRGVVVVVLLAYASGQELASRARVVHVPASRVPASVCVANGPVVDVTDHPSESGVYSVRCASGVVLVAGER